MTPARNYVQTFDRSPEEYRISKTLLISEQDFVRFESHSIHCDWVRKVSGSEKASKLLRSPYRKGRDQKHSTTLNDLTRKGHKLVLDLLSRVVFCLRISALSYDHVELSTIQICPPRVADFPAGLCLQCTEASFHRSRAGLSSLQGRVQSSGSLQQTLNSLERFCRLL